MRIVTDTGAPVAPGIGLGPTQFVDPFNRPDGALGNGWTDGADWDPDMFAPCGIYQGSVVCTDPRSRPGTYADPQDTPPGELDGDLYQGIGCAWRDFGTDTIRASYVWSGLWTPPTHTEGGPLIHVTPGTTEHGLGVWMTIVGATCFYAVGTIGAPPELWDPMEGAIVPHVEGTPRTIELRSDGAGVTAWLDGAQVNCNLGDSPAGLDPFPIPAALLGSELHGFCIDTHLTDEANIPTTPVVRSVAFAAS